MRLPKYVLPISVMGTLTGSFVLLKDSLGGPRYQGKENIAGKTVIVTGANSGIGKEIVRELARRRARVIMACRDLEKCEEVRKEIMLATANLNIQCNKLDLASFGSIRAFCKNINMNEAHVEILVNNAGVMMCPKSYTQDGLEMQMGVNYFGHFLLTYLLLDKLKSSAPSRIIILSSMAYRHGRINFEDLNSAKDYEKFDAYAQSKLANLLHMRELAHRLEGSGVTVNSVHPGTVNTQLGRHLSVSKSYISGFLISIFVRSPVQGAQTPLQLALDEALEKTTGAFYSDGKQRELLQQAEDDEAARRLWAISMAWTRADKT